mgnify:CR=1 FL=1
MNTNKINIRVIDNGFIVSAKRASGISEEYSSKDDLSKTIGKLILEKSGIEQLSGSGFKNGSKNSYIEYEVKTNQRDSCFKEEKED